MNGVKMIAYRNAERFVRELMLIRRSLELLGLDADAYDMRLSEWVEQYHKEFSEMTMEDMMLVMSASMDGGQP